MTASSGRVSIVLPMSSTAKASNSRQLPSILLRSPIFTTSHFLTWGTFVPKGYRGKVGEMPIVLFFHYNLNIKPRSCSFLVYYDCLKCKVFEYKVILCLNIQVCSKNKFENFVIF